MTTLPLRVLKPSWVDLHWKSTLLWLCLAAFILMGLFGLALIQLMKSSEAYSEAMELAKSHPAAITALGQPIREGFFLTGNINLKNSSGHAKLKTSLHGSKAKGTLHILATKIEGKWHFDRLLLEVENSDQQIELMPPSSEVATKFHGVGGVNLSLSLSQL